MGFPVFFDTCVLFGEVVNDVILRLAEELLFTPYWSGDVLDELERNLTPRIEEVRAQRRICAILRQPDSTHQDAQ
ncbi:PIN domain-containing protein [Bifidobacterium animalis subsp. animalis]|nr:PIN domain-containing protein [Bifidobacterium animalis]MCR1994885.1 PIN domain-containing protein [Bifidobacterium animalis subsp. animalis]